MAQQHRSRRQATAVPSDVDTWSSRRGMLQHVDPDNVAHESRQVVRHKQLSLANNQEAAPKSNGVAVPAPKDMQQAHTAGRWHAGSDTDEVSDLHRVVLRDQTQYEMRRQNGVT